MLFDAFGGSGYLCNASTACGSDTHDSASRAGTVLGLSVTPLRYLEAYGSLHYAATSNDQHSPGLIDVVGNTTVGAKLFLAHPLAGLLSAGGLAELELLNGSGSIGVSGKGTSFRLAALGGVDLRGLSESPLPLRILTNLAYLADNSGALIAGIERSRDARITRVERFGLGISRVDRFQAGLGAEVALPVVQPFVEWNLEVPVNRQGYVCNPRFSYSGDRCLHGDASLSAFPSTFTVGARVSPFLKGLSAAAALDIGTSGTSNFIEELAPTLPWDIWLGFGYAFDAEEPEPEPVVVIEHSVAPAAPTPPTLRIRGFVHAHGKEEGIANAILHYRERDLTAMASGTDGRFISAPLEPGSYTFDVEADGYNPGECAVVVAMASAASTPRAAGGSGSAPPAPAPPSASSFTDLDCELEPLPRAGNVVGRVLDATSSAPIAGATVQVTDALHRSLQLVTDASGSFRFERVIPGTLTLDAQANGFLFHAQASNLVARQDVNAELKLRKRPKPGHLSVTANELKISQPLQFAQDSAAISPESEPLLEEVADALASNPRISHVEIQGYTDNSGAPEHNLSLSVARANSVLDWLAAHGIDAHRLTAKGYGQEKPISPNVTPQGHARNRRIQFMILEQAASP
jgi:outer membrane protein OmpA-like peptidoglycan-associated protein